jgi:hypothetical protein
MPRLVAWSSMRRAAATSSGAMPVGIEAIFSSGGRRLGQSPATTSPSSPIGRESTLGGAGK